MVRLGSMIEPRSVGLRVRGALLAGRAAGATSRRLGRGGGTALPGAVAGRVAPGLLDALVPTLGHGAVTVTGTNGKTTTAHLLSSIARRAGWTLLANASGSNLERGVTGAFVDAATAAGGLPGASARLGLFEVDEAALPALFPRLRPRVALFLNLFRDQLDRYGEIDSVAEGWHRMLIESASGAALVLNADDPSVMELANAARGPVLTFGIADPAVALSGGDHAADARFCRCGAPFAYRAHYVGHLGEWRCTGCERRRPEPDIAARNVQLGAEQVRFELVIAGQAAPLTLPLAGLYSVYNALAAAAGAHALGLPPAAIREALAAAGPAFGRQERFAVQGRDVRVWLAKNPAGLNEVLRALTTSERPLRLLALLNDGVQDGQDVSWIYDAGIELLAGRTASVMVSGDRADDLALRFALAGVEPALVEPHIVSALHSALSALRETPEGQRLDVVGTYTAMIVAREAIAAAAGAPPYWAPVGEGSP